LAAFEAEPHREQVTEKSAEAGNHCGLSPPKMLGDEHRRRALERVAKEGRSRKAFAASAQHVGRADIAGAHGAEGLRAGKACEDQAERNGAAEVTEDQRSGIGDERGYRGEWIRHAAG